MKKFNYFTSINERLFAIFIRSSGSGSDSLFPNEIYFEPKIGNDELSEKQLMDAVSMVYRMAMDNT